jgi:hypothetical protein
LPSHCIIDYLIGSGQYLDIYIRSPYSSFIMVGDITGHQQKAVEVWNELLFSLNYSYISLVVGDFLPKVEKVNISITSCEHPNLLFWKVQRHHWASTEINIGQKKIRRFLIIIDTIYTWHFPTHWGKVNISITRYRTPNSCFSIIRDTSGDQSKSFPALYYLDFFLIYHDITYLSFFGPIGVRSISP